MCSINSSSSCRESSKQRRMQLTTPMTTIMLMIMNEDATVRSTSVTSSSLKGNILEYSLVAKSFQPHMHGP